MTAVNDITVELAFAADYEVRVLEHLPATSTAIEFAREGRVSDGAVLIEVVTPTGDVWSGVVAKAAKSLAAAHSGVYSTPAPDQVCVVARGDAYFIDARDPTRWSLLEDTPVVAVRSAPTDGLLVFATPWRVVGVDYAGVKWRTSRIAVDGIRLEDVANGQIRGVADPHDQESRKFFIELSSGYHCGGFPFPG